MAIGKLDPKNKGTFTATQERTGKSVDELANSKNALTRKRANFARMAKRGWKPLTSSDKVKEMSSFLDGVIELEKIPSIQKQDEKLLKKNGLRNQTIKSGILGTTVGGAYGAGVGAILHKVSKDPKAAMLLPPKLRASASKHGAGRFALVGAGIGAALAAPSIAAQHYGMKKRIEGLKRYPKSKGEFGNPGYTESYPENQPWPTISQYFKRPKKLSSILDDIINFGEMEDRQTITKKAGRVAVTAGIGGLAGRTLAWHPVHGGKMNRATAIGAGLGAATQIAAEHIAGAKKGIHGHPIKVTDESRKSTRDMGKGLAGAGLFAGAIKAQIRSRKDFNDQMMSLFKKSYRIPLTEEDAAREQMRNKRRMGIEGETFIPKMPNFARKAAERTGLKRVSIDETGGNLEDKLSRLAKGAKGTPEGEAAARKLHGIRSKAGKTFMGRAKNTIRKIFTKSPKGGIVGHLPLHKLSSNLDGLIDFAAANYIIRGKINHAAADEAYWARKSWNRLKKAQASKLRPSPNLGSPLKTTGLCERLQAIVEFGRGDYVSKSPITRFQPNTRSGRELDKSIARAIRYKQSCAAKDVADYFRWRRGGKLTKTLSSISSNLIELADPINFGILSIGTAKKVFRGLDEAAGRAPLFRPSGLKAMAGYIPRGVSQAEAGADMTAKYGSHIPGAGPHSIIVPRERGLSQELQDVKSQLPKGVQEVTADSVATAAHERGHAADPDVGAVTQMQKRRAQRFSFNPSDAGGKTLAGAMMQREVVANRNVLGQVQQHGSPEEVSAWKKYANTQMKVGYRKPMFDAATQGQSLTQKKQFLRSTPFLQSAQTNLASRLGILFLKDTLDNIIQFADPRPRNNLGEFSGNDAEGPNPNSMNKVYKTAGTVGEMTAGGLAAKGVSKGLKTAYEKIKQLRK